MPGVSYVPMDECQLLAITGSWTEHRISVTFSGFGDYLDNFQRVVAKAVRYWSGVLRVRGIPGGHHLVHTREITCGIYDYFMAGSKFYPESYGGEPGSDLVLKFELAPSGSAFAGRSNVCVFDVCGRPLMGEVEISAQVLETKSEIELLSLVLHEMAHVLGFNTHHILKWIDPIDGTRLFDSTNSFVLSYIQRGDGSARFVDIPRIMERVWTVLNIPFYGRFVQEVVPKKFITLVTRRGAGESCSCPINDRNIYTDSDLTKCFQSPESCIFEISSPKVVAAARMFYNCPNLSGMELASHEPSDASFIESHWKPRTLFGELMNPTQVTLARFVSPMTLAFLDDSGWYQVDYSRGTLLEPGAVWGYLSGCDLLEKPCIDKESQEVISVPHTSIFSTSSGCSSNLFAAHWSGDWEWDSNLDRCPIITESDPCGAYHPNSRCILMGSSGSCKRVHCINENSYKFEVVVGKFTATCYFGGQVIELATGRSFTCTDPVQMCRSRGYRHYDDLVDSFNPNIPPKDEIIDGLPDISASS